MTYKPIQVTERLANLVLTLWEFDGVLSERQVRTYVYPGLADGTFRNLKARFRDAGFIGYPTRQQLTEHPVPEPFLWLGLKGIAYVAETEGINVDLDRVTSERQEKKLETWLRKQGIYWRREPHWATLKHDIMIGDVRLMAKAATEQAGLIWEGWTPESSFQADPPTVTYTLPERRKGGQVVEVKQTGKVIPDGFFVISRPATKPGKIERIAYLVEVDNSTRRGREKLLIPKIIMGQAYLKSKAYSDFSGLTFGRWLLVTGRPVRRDNIKRNAETINRMHSHYFAAIDDLTIDGFYSEPVWHLLGKAEPVPLLHPAK